MKKQITLSLIVIAAMLLLLSFKTKKAGTTPHFWVKKQVMSDAYYQIYTSYFTYDPEGRIIRLEEQNPDTLISTTSYGPAGMMVITHNSSVSGFDTITYSTNGQGMIMSDSRSNTFEYNADGKMVKGAMGETYTWLNGDLMTRTYTATNGLHVVRFIYTNLPETRDFGDYMWGFQSAHLVETVIDSLDTIRHRYIIDRQGRIITDSAGTSVYHYTY